jgi:hypothetical protein
LDYQILSMGGFMKKKLLICVCLVVFVVALAGCAGVTINPEDMAGIKNVGILSLTVKKTGPQTPGNDAVLQEVANYALLQVQNKLKSVTSFKLYPVASYYKLPEYQNAGTVAKAAGAMAYLKNNPDAMDQNTSAASETTGDFMAALKAGIKAAAESAAVQKDPVAAAQKILDDNKKEMIAASGMPFIPYGVINNVKPGDGVTYVNGVRQGGGNEGLKQMMLEEVKAVCAKTRMDAMIVVHVETEANPPKGVYVIVGGNRVVGTLRLNMTMLMIDKKGRIIADLDWPSMDDLAPMKLAVPHSVITEWAIPNKAVRKSEIDLKDNGGAVLNAFKEMSVDSAGRMTETLRQALGEIK